jgi:hypothetical protein
VEKTLYLAMVFRTAAGAKYLERLASRVSSLEIAS